jgi:hypothetical protein
MQSNRAEKISNKKMVNKFVKSAMRISRRFYPVPSALFNTDECNDLLERLNRVEPRQRRILKRYMNRVHKEYVKDHLERAYGSQTHAGHALVFNKLRTEVEDAMEPYK